MDWIKRNLYFLIGGLVALALMGMAGWFLYSKWQLNNDKSEKLTAAYDQLKTLNNQNPHPGNSQVDNVKAAKDQQQEILDIIQKARSHFQTTTPIPNVEKVTEYDFSVALSRTIDQLQHGATNASVIIPPDYKFAFQAQWHRVTFATGSLQPLSVQLGDVKAICDILFQAKVNYLDNVRRERICADDQQGPATDYVEKKSVTNELAVIVPYEVSFRCFSPELATVLAGFASSPYGIVVKAINVEQAPASETPAFVSPMVVAQPIYPTDQQQSAARSDMMARRYGIGRYSRGPAAPPPPQPTYAAPVAVAPAKPSTTPVLDEKQLKVTLNLGLVKLLARK